MSGAYGWHQSSSNDSPARHVDHSYDDARRQYQPTVTVTQIGTAPTPAPAPKPAQQVKAAPVPSVQPKRTMVAAPAFVSNYPEAKHSLKSTAANVMIVVVDTTISMKLWLDEIYKRLPTLYIEACQYLGTEDLEILFIVHGDVRTDNFPVQVARFGRGIELDQIISSFYRKCGGGGQGDESQEVVAYYLLKQVDTTTAQNVYTYFITDEAACDVVDPDAIKQHLGLPFDSELTQTTEVFAGLQRRGKVFTVLCETNNPDYDSDKIKRRWEANVGKNNIMPLSDARRVVDAILFSIAKLTGQAAQFTQNFVTRQQGSQYTNQNLATIQKSVALIGGGLPVTPAATSKKPLI